MKSNPGTESRKNTNGFRKCWFLLPVIIGALLLTQITGGFAQTRAIQPVSIETKTPQNEDISYIYAESHALVIGVSKYTNGWRIFPEWRMTYDKSPRPWKTMALRCIPFVI